VLLDQRQQLAREARSALQIGDPLQADDDRIAVAGQPQRELPGFGSADLVDPARPQPVCPSLHPHGRDLARLPRSRYAAHSGSSTAISVSNRFRLAAGMVCP
jgi:hypothetical protein